MNVYNNGMGIEQIGKQAYVVMYAMTDSTKYIIIDGPFLDRAHAESAAGMTEPQANLDFVTFSPWSLGLGQIYLHGRANCQAGHCIILA